MIKKICKCSAIFYIFSCHIKNGGGKYCSRKCSSKYRKKKEKTIYSFKCKECGKEFSVRKGRGGTYEYCSILCMAKSRGRKMRGSAHFNWKGGKSDRSFETRKNINKLKKEKGYCEECGGKSNLQGHHIIPIAKNKNLAEDKCNIQILCDACHAKKHPELSGMIKRPRERKGAFLNCSVCYKEYYVKPYKKLTSKCCSRKCNSLRAVEIRHGKRVH